MNPHTLIDFWFGPLTDGLCQPERRRALFSADAGFDSELAARFGGAVEQALAGALDAWAEDASGRLALVLLLDQLPRNLFRGTARAFAGDAAALAHARAAVAAGQDQALALEPRVFMYLPFEHAEDLAAQDEGLELMQALHAAQDEGSAAASVVAGYLAHLHDHRALIAQFGRFPHRNAALDRSDTDAERQHRERDTRDFGQH